MTTARKLMLLASGVAAATLAGCGQAVPQDPSWDVDVFPIMMARCVRCHNGQGTVDPLAAPPAVGPAPGNFDHASRAEFMQSPDASLLPLFKDYVPNGMMPPPPAAKLSDWEVQTIMRWVNSSDHP